MNQTDGARSSANFVNVDPMSIDDIEARKWMYLRWPDPDLEDDQYGIIDERAGNEIEIFSDRNLVLARIAELRRGRGEYVPN